jgi:hypothetical protein
MHENYTLFFISPSRPRIDHVQKLVKERAPLNLHPKRVVSRYL